MQLRNCLCRFQLPLLHSLPADESIQIIDQEHHKANDHRQVADILHRCQGPQNDQHHIVGGIGQGEVGAAAEGQVYGNEAGGHGQGAGEHIGRAEIVQNEIKNHRHNHSQDQHSNPFPSAKPVDRHLCLVSLVRILNNKLKLLHNKMQN